MLTYNLIGSGLVALGALSMATMRARANWGMSAPAPTIGAQEAASEPAPSRDSDGGDHQRRGPSVVELGGSTGSRLIIVSNRVAVPESGGKQMAGGLVVAVKAALRNRTGVWFGWSGKIDETETAEPRTIARNRITYAVIDLSKNDFEEYYNGLANRVLWPILHYRVDLQDYSRADHSGYMRVNRLFADRLAAFLRDDDVVWVHDYHLMPLARELRARGRLNPIGFFLHIPCAPLDILRTLPHHEEILGALADYDLVGFQTENDRDNFAAYLLTMPGAKEGRGLTFEVGGAAPASALSRSASRPPLTRGSPARRRARRSPRRSGRASTGCVSCSASTGSTIPRASSSASTPSTDFSKPIRSGDRASPCCRSPRGAGPTSSTTPRSKTK